MYRHLKTITTIFTLLSTTLFGFHASIKHLGMAGVAQGHLLDSVGAAYNPSGLVDVGNRIDFGVAWIHTEGEAVVNNNPINSGRFNGHIVKDIATPDFGISYMCHCNLAIGIISYNKSYVKTKYAQNFTILGTSPLKVEHICQAVAPVISYRLHPCFNVGISLDCYIQRLKINGLENFDNAAFSINPGSVTNNGYDYSFGVGVTLGFQWKVRPNITLGGSYSPETSMSRFKKYDGFLARAGKINLPEKFTGGISIDVTPCLTLGFDVEYINYSKIEALSNPIAADLTVQKLGQSNGSGFDWKDQMIYRIGLQYQVNPCWSLRTGFRHGTDKFEPQGTSTNILLLSTVEEYLTLGTSYRPCCDVEVSSYFAWGLKNTIIGAPNSIPALLGGGEANVTEKKWILGLSFAKEF